MAAASDCNVWLLILTCLQHRNTNPLLSLSAVYSSLYSLFRPITIIFPSLPLCLSSSLLLSSPSLPIYLLLPSLSFFFSASLHLSWAEIFCHTWERANYMQSLGALPQKNWTFNNIFLHLHFIWCGHVVATTKICKIENLTIYSSCVNSTRCTFTISIFEIKFIFIFSATLAPYPAYL